MVREMKVTDGIRGKLHVVGSVSQVPRQAKNYTRDPLGLASEDAVKDHLANLDHTVIGSEVAEDILYDIDLYLDGVPTSIKAQHKGMSINPKTGNPYGDLCFEIVTEQASSGKWENEAQATLGCPEKALYLVDRLKVRRPGWFWTGRVEQYLILQGNRLRLYRKQDLLDIITTRGWHHVLGLSWQVREGQNGRDTICGCLKVDETPYVKEWILPSDSWLTLNAIALESRGSRLYKKVS